MDTYYIVEQIIHIMKSVDGTNVSPEHDFFVKYSKLPNDCKMFKHIDKQYLK